MVYEAFSIFDAKGLMYSPPFFMATKGLAIRRFSETATDLTTSIGLHPEDFTLFHIGAFHDQTGLLEHTTTPQPLIKASETINKPIVPMTNGPGTYPDNAPFRAQKEAN